MHFAGDESSVVVEQFTTCWFEQTYQLGTSVCLASEFVRNPSAVFHGDTIPGLVTQQ